MLEDVVDCFAMADRTSDPAVIQTCTVDKGQGRREHRRGDVIGTPDVLAWLDRDGQWPGVQSVLRITATRSMGETAAAPGTRAVRS